MRMPGINVSGAQACVLLLFASHKCVLSFEFGPGPPDNAETCAGKRQCCFREQGGRHPDAARIFTFSENLSGFPVCTTQGQRTGVLGT